MNDQEIADQVKGSPLHRRDAAALPIKSYTELREFGEDLARSGIFKGCPPPRGVIIAAICIQERISILEFRRAWHVQSGGDILMRSDRMLAEFQAMGGKFKWLEHTNTKATARAVMGENDVTESYTIEDAKQAQLVKPGSGYDKDPAAQLRARLVSKLVRMVGASAIAGAYCPEEAGATDEEDSAYTYEAGDAPTPEPERPKRKEPTPEPTPEPEPEAKPEATPTPVKLGVIDPTVSPVKGKRYGTRWFDMDVDVLRQIKAMAHLKPEITPEHLKEIDAIIDLSGTGNKRKAVKK